MCFGEAFHWLGVQGVEGLILDGALFLPSVASKSQGGFGVTELMLSAPSWIFSVFQFLTTEVDSKLPTSAWGDSTNKYVEQIEKFLTSTGIK
jgi:hypothetical protein